MQLTHVEVADLVAAMVDAFDVPALRTMLYQRLGKRLDLLVNTQAVEANLNVIVNEVVRHAQNGWAHLLVAEVFTARSQNPRVKAFHAAYRARVQKLPPNLYAAHEVRFGNLFVNRKDLRDRLKRFFEASPSRVFAVNGPDGSGRAYTYRLIELLTENGSWYRVVPLDLADFGSRDPLSLLRWIFAGIGSAGPAAPERDSREVFDLCNALEAELNRRGENLCLVFSRFSGANLTRETGDFIAHLAVQAEKRVKHLRVVLLGHGQGLPSPINRSALKEDVAPLTPDDFAECAAGILNQRGVPITPAEIRLHIDQCFEACPTLGPDGNPDLDRLANIESAVRQFIAEAEEAHKEEMRAAQAGGVS